MGEIKEILVNPFLNTYYLARSLFWKRDESIVLLDSWFGGKFADNPRFLYQYLSENKKALKLSHVVWVTRDPAINSELCSMGYESYMIDSKESIYYHKHAKYHIVNNAPNDFDFFSGELLSGYSYGAKRINLWHGIAGKGVKFANREKIELYSSNQLFKLFLKLHTNKLWRLFFEQKCGWGDSYYLVQSTQNFKNLKKCFRLPDGNYIMSGYPRVCSDMVCTKEEKKILDIIKKYKYVFLYLPTFRDKPLGIEGDVKNSIISWVHSSDILWIQKAHSASNEKNEDAADTENFIELDTSFDINTLMPHISCLVTDYSSCFLEAMYYRKDLIFFAPDFDEYISRSRGLTYDPATTLAGPICRTTDELIGQIINYPRNAGKLKKQNYEEVRKVYWEETEHKTMTDIWNDIVIHTEKRK